MNSSVFWNSGTLPVYSASKKIAQKKGERSCHRDSTNFLRQSIKGTNAIEEFPVRLRSEGPKTEPVALFRLGIPPTLRCD